MAARRRGARRNSQDQMRAIDDGAIAALRSFHSNSRVVAGPKRFVILRFDWNFKVKLQFAFGVHLPAET